MKKPTSCLAQVIAIPFIIILSGAVQATPRQWAPGDGGNGNHYELIITPVPQWIDAANAAGSLSFMGAIGHLASITSAAENAFLDETFNLGQDSSFAWIGGVEITSNAWAWQTAADDPANDRVFWNGGPGGSPPPGEFANWASSEPNNSGLAFAAMNVGNVFAGFISRGDWIDSEVSNPLDPIIGYVVEYETGTVDIDGDSVIDELDNCVTEANPDQRDTDGDDIGNPCDPDVAAPNDCIVNFLDLNVYKSNFFQAGDFDTDNNGDGQTNFLDLNIVKNLFFGPPGPSADGCN